MGKWLRWWFGRKEFDLDKELQKAWDEDRLKFISQNTWVVSDLHLDHRNIIKYCNRPFGSIEEMNETLVNNWNSVVGLFDRVFYLGDLALRRHEYWLRRLNGLLIYTPGNHDSMLPKTPNIEYIVPYIRLTIGGLEFVMVHNPKDVPEGPYDWVIHGHVHNDAPFIDAPNKRVNVSVDAINYTPINLFQLVWTIQQQLATTE